MSDKKTAEPSLLKRIQDADVKVSKLVFQWSLPLPLEFLLSLPGNLIGPPFVQVVGVLWFIILLDKGANVRGDDDDFMTLSFVWALAIVCTLLLVLVPWILFLGIGGSSSSSGRPWILSRYFFSHASFALCPLAGIGLANAYNSTAMAARADDSNNNKRHITTTLCNQFLMYYNASCIILLWLKQGTQRPRPCCVFPEYIARKHFPIIPRTLAKLGPNTSFPSGDVMAATCLALPLWYHDHLENYGGPFFFYTPLLLVGLTALGRMYFLAHHLCDTLAGVAVPLCLHQLCHITTAHGGRFLDMVFPELGHAQWYHPFGAFLALVVASLFRRGNQK
jgi:membrane-associated phospholipid phosphatase